MALWSTKTKILSNFIGLHLPIWSYIILKPSCQELYKHIEILYHQLVYHTYTGSPRYTIVILSLQLIFHTYTGFQDIDCTYIDPSRYIPYLYWPVALYHSYTGCCLIYHTYTGLLPYIPYFYWPVNLYTMLIQAVKIYTIIILSHQLINHAYTDHQDIYMYHTYTCLSI